jgi:predicted HD superfamily hydrolase involved in NAD metabolism
MMKDYLFIKNEVERILKPKRFKHSLNVEKESLKLAKIYDVDEESCKIAAILHDCAKYFKDEELVKYANKYGILIDEVQYNYPCLLHGPVGAMYAKEKFGIENKDILNSIAYHTTGRPCMSKLEKVIYLADLIEEGRTFPELDEIRNISIHNLDEALILACNCTINYIMKSNTLIHPLTIEFRNSLLLRGMHKNG